MSKRHLILAALSIAVIVVAILGYLRLKDQPEYASPFDAVSSRAAALLTINNYQRSFKILTSESQMWQELSSSERVAELNAKMLLLDSVMNNVMDPGDLEELKFLVAFYPTETYGFKHTFIFFPRTSMDRNNLNNLKALCSQISEYSVFEDQRIYEGTLSLDDLPNLYFTTYNGLVIAAFHADLIEDAIRNAMNSENLAQDKEFQSVKNTTGEFADWNFYINYKEKTGLRFLGMEADKVLSSDVIWSGWTALDATLHSNLFLLNGFSNAGKKTYLSLFDKQKPQDIDVIDIMPKNVALFFHFGVSNYAKYIEAKKNYFKAVGKEEEYLARIEQLNYDHHFDIESEFEKWTANEFGIMYIKKNGIKREEAKVAFFRMSDHKRAKSTLDRLHEEGLLNEPGLAANQLNIENLFDGIESDLFNGIDKPYFALVDKYLLLSSHPSLIEEIRSSYEVGNTLKKSSTYSELAENLSDQSNIYLYVQSKDGMAIFDDVLHKESMTFLNENPNVLKKFEQIGFQFKESKNDLFYQHTALNYHPDRRIEGNTLWELTLDTGIAMKPKIVYNHYSNAREIFVQDLANTIYLIDNKGEILWKRQMKEPIVSDVHQIDVYKNNKLQILFSGESSIYLIDRKGRDVESFPVQLPAVSTNGLAVIDYEKNREYRILIAVRGGKILNFDRFGNKIKGWSFRTDEEITSPIRYFLLNGKDYITCIGSAGSPFVLNRRGEQRIKFNDRLPENLTDFKLDLSNDIYNCTFITTNENGNVVKMHFNGEKEILNFDQFSPSYQFMYEDINNDHKSDYIFLDSLKLMAFDHKREKLFEVELSGTTQTEPGFYRFADGYGKIGVSISNERQVYLYRDAGSLDRNFPLKGDGLFTISDINKDDHYNVIVGLGSKLMVYNLE